MKEYTHTESYQILTQIRSAYYVNLMGFNSSPYPHVLEIKFLNTESFNEYIEFIEAANENKREEKLREENPTLQKAYEEYKLLLQLTK
jgi:hypothetical protein